MSQGFEPRPKGEENFGNWQVEPDLPKSEGRGCLKGCLIAAAVLLVLAMIAAWIVSLNWRDWAGAFVRTGLEETLNETDLPAEEKEQIQEQVERVVTAFEEGTLTGAQVELLVDELVQSPLPGAVIAFTIEKQYFDRSGLSDEEKDAGRTTLRRCVRGYSDGDLTEEDVDAALVHVGTKDADGNWEFRDDVTDEELRKFLAEATERADTAGVAETVKEVDPSDEIKRIVDSILKPDRSVIPES
ncbi:MAG: hypothetical protein MK102_00405 [Fuerstiella sp.]|nr:hypothetical protein [Fuerstiella sp.]